MSGQEVEEPPQTSAAGTAPTTIELCGSLKAEIAGRSVTSQLPGRKGRALFAFLVLNRHRPVTRDELIDVLWPEFPPYAPDAGLNTLLARLRKAVGDGVVEGRSELRLHLDPAADVDVERAGARAQEAERALTRGDAAAAVAAATTALEIVERPLLPAMEGGWVEARRAELDGMQSDLLEVLARAALAGGDPAQLPAAERAACSLVERHPFRESGYVLLMQAQAGRGNLAEATLTFDRLRCLLRDELGTVPSPDVSALHDELLQRGRQRAQEARPGPAAAARADRPAGPVPLPVIGGAAGASAFVGRESYLERLRAPWLEAGTGQRRLALLVGEPGVGKTRLASRFAAEVHAAGATVLYGRCDEEPLLAYQPFVQALRHYLRHGDWDAEGESAGDLQQLARLLPEAAAGASAVEGSFGNKSPDGDRYLLFEAVGRLLGRATRARPLLLVLDDLHWADKPTVLLLRHLLRLTDPARMMVLGIFRDVEVDSDHPLIALVADLRGERRCDRLAIEGLDEHETDALVASRLDAPASTGFVRGLRTQTEGNPFFIEEALRSLVEARAVEAGAAAPEHALASMGVPESVSDVILRRLGRVSDGTREALTAAAVIGREFEVTVAEALLGRPAEEVIEALEEAMAAGLVGEVDGAVDRFMFSHALVRDAIYQRMSNSRRLRMHLRVGEALEAGCGHSAAGAGELAHHFFLARGVGGGARAARYAIRAGEEAARSLAYEESAAQYRRALEALELDQDEALRCDVLLALGRVQWQAGEAAALETYFEAADSARRRGDAQQLAGAALGLGERYWEARAVDEKYQGLLAEALERLSTDDSKPRVLLLARMAQNQHFTAQQAYGTELSLEALDMARRLGDVDTLVRALLGRHITLLHIEHLEERLRLIDEVLALVKGHLPLTAEAHQWRLFDRWERGDIAAAQRDHARLTELAHELRQPLLEHLALGWQGTFAHLAGDVDEAERLAGRSFEFADRASVSSATSALASMLFTLRRQQGRIGELLPMMRSLEVGGSASPAWKAALALAEVETGAVREGSARYERLAGDDFSAIPRDWYWSITTALLTETCVALRDVDRAARLYELLEPFADRCVQVIFTASWGSVHRYLGLLAGVMDRHDLAERHFESALDANGAMGAVLMTAETQCAYGELLLRRDDPGDRDRAATLGALADAVAAPRRLDGLRRRAQALVAGRG